MNMRTAQIRWKFPAFDSAESSLESLPASLQAWEYGLFDHLRVEKGNGTPSRGRQAAQAAHHLKNGS